MALTAPLGASAGAEDPGAARRVVSMNPSLTEVLVALDATDLLVGVDDYSARARPEVEKLPTVGGLFNPSLEAVVALQPDLVVFVPSAQQRDFRRQLEGLGIAVLELPNITLEQVFASIEILGQHTGRRAAARARIEAIRRTWADVERALAGRVRPRAVLVLQREPLYIVGRGSFIDAMLRAAGAENVGAAFPEPYPRVALEWLIEVAPEVILDASEDTATPLAHWSRWPSLPAVASGRVEAVPADQVTRPGPYLDTALRLLTAALHGQVAR